MGETKSFTEAKRSKTKMVPDSTDLVVLNVNGTRFEVTQKIFKAIASSMFLEISEDKKEYYFDRHVPSFLSILDYFQRGELHLPDDVCPNVFKREMKFWGLEHQKMEECCHSKFGTFLDDQKLLSLFNKTLSQQSSVVPERGTTIKSRIWRLLDNPSSSRWAQLYLAISVLFVIVSLFVMAASTHPVFMRELNDAEYSEVYKDRFGRHPPQLVRLRRGRRNTFGPNDTVRAPPPQPPGNPASTNDDEEYTLTNVHSRLDYLTYMEYATMVFFTLDLIFRIASCPDKCMYFKDLINVSDIVALATMYITLAVNYLKPSERHSISLFDILECLQIARVFRFFRIVKDVMGFRVLVYTIKMSYKELALLILYLALCVIIFSGVIYYCERDNMKSIPDAMWWVVITMTTVGYGDMTPTTFLGKVVGSITAVAGVLLIAVTIPVFVNNFIMFYTYSKSLDHVPSPDRKRETSFTKVVKVAPAHDDQLNNGFKDPKI